MPPPSSTSARVEAALLVVLAFVMPLWEAPKNLLVVAYLVTWLVNRTRTGDFGGPWDRWDTLIALWIASGFAVAAGSGIHAQEWHGALDIVRYGSILWCLRRSRETVWTGFAVVLSLALGTAAGLAWGYWAWTLDSKRYFVELHSVGHVNHSAIYTAMVLGATASLVFAAWGRLRVPMRAGGIVALLYFMFFLVKMQSRAALGVGIAVVVVLGLAWYPRKRLFAGLAVAIVLAVTASLIVFRPDVVAKHLTDVQNQNVLAFRDQIWRTALAAWRQFPVFGVGMDNFSFISRERVAGWASARGDAFDDSSFFFTSHGHSLLFNTLAERGTAGTAVLALVLAAWLASLVRGYPGANGGEAAWLAWGGGASAWLVTVGAGFANTTLHHEHGLLAAMLFGLWLAHEKTARS